MEKAIVNCIPHCINKEDKGTGIFMHSHLNEDVPSRIQQIDYIVNLFSLNLYTQHRRSPEPLQHTSSPHTLTYNDPRQGLAS